MVVDVLGQPIRSGQGAVLFHEHLQFGWPGFSLDPGARQYVDRNTAVTALEGLANAGVEVLLDATPIDCGRDLLHLARIAARSPVQVVGATGIYHHERGFPAHLASLSVDELSAMFRSDLLASTGARAFAGILKVATASLPFAQRELRALRAAGIVSHDLGVPIVTHTDSVEAAKQQLEILVEAGASPSQIVLGHLDTADIDSLSRLASNGTFLGIDRFGHGGSQDDASRVRLVASMVEQGLLSSILISHDAPLEFLGRITVRPTNDPNPFTHIHRVIVPQLKAAGLSDSAVQALLVDNPRRFLTGSAQ